MARLQKNALFKQILRFLYDLSTFIRSLRFNLKRWWEWFCVQNGTIFNRFCLKKDVFLY